MPITKVHLFGRTRQWNWFVTGRQ